MNDQTLTVLVGLPGSGKSTWAGKSTQQVIAVDNFLRTSGRGQNPSPSDNQRAREQALIEMLQKLQTGASVIYDHTNLNPTIRSEIFTALKTAGLKIPVIARYFATDFFTCIQQNQGREFNLNPLNIFYLALALEPPVKKEGFGKVEITHRTEPLTKSPTLAQFLTAPKVENLNPEALKNEVLELQLLAEALERMEEDWATNLPENLIALVENCTENEVTLSPELTAAWLFKDLFRIITEHFAVTHPDTPLPANVNLNERIFEQILRQRLADYEINLSTVKKLLTGYFVVAEKNATPPPGATEKLLSILLVS